MNRPRPEVHLFGIGFALGALIVMAAGCVCWLLFTDVVLTNTVTGERGLGWFGELGIPVVCVVALSGLLAAGVLVFWHRRIARQIAWLTLTVAIGYHMFGLLLLAAHWSRPLWRLT